MKTKAPAEPYPTMADIVRMKDQFSTMTTKSRRGHRKLNHICVSCGDKPASRKKGGGWRTLCLGCTRDNRASGKAWRKRRRAMKSLALVKRIPIEAAARLAVPEVMSMANEVRTRCNKLDTSQRQHAFHRGMQRVYGASLTPLLYRRLSRVLDNLEHLNLLLEKV